MSDDPLNFDEEKKKIEEANKRTADRKTNDLKKVLGFPEGRRFVWELLSDSGIFHTSFSQNALTMAFNEGHREIGLGILDEINKNMPELFTQMRNEYVSNVKSQKAEPPKDLI